MAFLGYEDRDLDKGQERKRNCKKQLFAVECAVECITKMIVDSIRMHHTMIVEFRLGSVVDLYS